MDKKFFNIFLLIFLAGILILPQNCFGQEYQLSEIQANNILNSAQQKLIDEWINITSSSDFSEPEKQAALFLIRSGIQKKELCYWLEQVPKEYLKTLIKTGAFLLFSPDISGILNKIEKETVKQAVKVAKDWLLQNEIKIANGPLKYAYISYKGNIQEPNFHYIISYHYLNSDKSEIIIEFYSPEAIEPPESKGSIGGLIGKSWDLEHWLKKGNEKLDPFIVRVNGGVDEVYGGYVWDESSRVEIIFSEPVPEYPFEPEPTSFWQKIKKAIENEISGMVQDFKDVFDVFSEIKKEISNLTGFEAQVSQPLSITFQEEELKEIEQEISSIQEEITEDVPPDNGNQELSQGDSLDGLQEKLDNIAEMIDAISKELGQIIQEQAQYGSEKEKIEENIDEETEESQEQEIQVAVCEINQAASPLQNKIIFNELAWMGTSNSANDEWLELKNISNQEIDLFGWQILDKDEQIKIIFEQGSISSKSFYLLERTNDETVPSIPADFIYNGALNNSDETLYLFDQDCQLQDKVSANPDWPAGDKNFKRTMERKNNLEWQTSANINGTPKAENSRGYSESSGGGGGGGAPSSAPDEEPEETTPLPDEEPEESDEPEPEEPEPEEPERPEYLFQDVVINEIAWAGTKAFAQDEWIELYNNSGEEIDISNWKLKSSDGSPDIVFTDTLATTTISNDGFYLIERTDDNTVSDISADFFGSFGYGLSNSQCEILSLFDQNNNLIDITACSEDGIWLAGKANPDYVSMERINPNLSGSDPDSWLDNNGIIINGLDVENKPIHGTPKAKNSVYQGIELKDTFWPMFGNNPQNTKQSQNIGPQTNNIRWLTDIGEPISKSAWTSLQPIIGKDEIIYIAISSYEDGIGELYAFNPDSSIKWVFDLENIPGAPATDRHGNIYIGTIETDNSDAKILAIDSDGNKKWEFSQAGARSITLSEQGILYFSSGKTLYALNSKNGEEIWHFEASERQSFSQPAIGQNNTLYAVFPGWWAAQDHRKGVLYAFDSATGEIKWTASQRLWWNMSAPVIDSQGNIYTAGDEIFAFDLDGNLKWKQLLAPSQPNWTGTIHTPWLAITSDNTIIAGGRGTYGSNPYYILRTYNLQGEMLLEFQPEEKPTDDKKNPEENIIQWHSQPIIDHKGNIFIYGTTYSNLARYSRLYSINKDNGKVDWQYDLNWWQTFLSLPAIGDNNHLYIAYFHQEKTQKQIKLIAFGPGQDSEEIEQDFSQSPWRMFGYNAQGINASHLFGPEDENLEKKIFIGDEESEDIYGNLIITPNGNLYCAAKIGKRTGIYTFNSDGSKKWFYELTQTSFVWPALGKDGAVYFISKTGVVAVDSFGWFKWKLGFKYLYNTTNPVVDENGVLYLISFYQKEDESFDNAIFAISPEGTMLWEKSFNSSEERKITSPAIGQDGAIYFGFKNIFYALNPDGSEKWKLEFTDLSKDEELANILSCPIVSSDGIIYIKSNQLQAVSPEGQIVWSLPGSNVVPRALSSEGILYTTLWPQWGGGGSLYGYLQAFDALSGQLKWYKKFLNNPLTSVIVDAQGNVYATGGSGKGVMAFNSQGEKLFDIGVKGFRNSFILGENKTIYIPGYYAIYTISPK
ncbi:MAG: PQQ-binding-like beta-propeller repeat protein [Minisyncoccales bacterium]